MNPTADLDDAAGDDPLWQRYEHSVADILEQIDPDAKIVRNKKIPGRFSQAPRQVDVWASGSVAGIELRIAIECKRYGRPVTVETIDQFIGKLLDIGADVGILYSYSGFTNSAVRRAESASNPRVLTVAVKTPDIVEQLRGVPGYPAAFLAQDVPPLWIEELSDGGFAYFVERGEWPRRWI